MIYISAESKVLTVIKKTKVPKKLLTSAFDILHSTFNSSTLSPTACIYANPAAIPDDFFKFFQEIFVFMKRLCPGKTIVVLYTVTQSPEPYEPSNLLTLRTNLPLDSHKYI